MREGLAGEHARHDLFGGGGPRGLLGDYRGRIVGRFGERLAEERGGRVKKVGAFQRRGGRLRGGGPSREVVEAILARCFRHGFGERGTIPPLLGTATLRASHSP